MVTAQKQNKYRELVLEASSWISRGLYDQDQIFYNMTNPPRRVHYSLIRNAIHEAKTT